MAWCDLTECEFLFNFITTQRAYLVVNGLIYERYTISLVNATTFDTANCAALWATDAVLSFITVRDDKQDVWLENISVFTHKDHKTLWILSLTREHVLRIIIIFDVCLLTCETTTIYTNIKSHSQNIHKLLFCPINSLGLLCELEIDVNAKLDKHPVQLLSVWRIGREIKWCPFMSSWMWTGCRMFSNTAIGKILCFPISV